MEQSLDVLREDVDLEVDLVAGLQRAQRRRGQRVRHERDGETAVAELRDRQRDALDGDRALLGAVTDDLHRRVDPEPAAVAFGIDRPHAAHAVDVALNVVPAERVARPERRLEVRLAPKRLHPPQRLRVEVEDEAAVLVRDDRQADAVDGDRVADRSLERRLDNEGPVPAGCDATALGDDAGEHGRSLRASAGGAPAGESELWQPRSLEVL